MEWRREGGCSFVNRPMIASLFYLSPIHLIFSFVGECLWERLWSCFVLFNRNEFYSFLFLFLSLFWNIFEFILFEFLRKRNQLEKLWLNTTPLSIVLNIDIFRILIIGYLNISIRRSNYFRNFSFSTWFHDTRVNKGLFLLPDEQRSDSLVGNTFVRSSRMQYPRIYIIMPIYLRRLYVMEF